MCNCRKEKLNMYRDEGHYTPQEILVLNCFIVNHIKFCPFCGENLQPERSKREDFFLKKPNKEELIPLDMDDFLSFVK
jgi:hypothetical protein